MIIDIIIVIATLIAIVAGWRRGFIVQLCQLAGLYFAILVAPEFADEIGEYISTDPAVAYIAGFAIIIVAAWLVVWIIAPLLRKILFWDFLRRVDSLLGMALAIVALFIIASACCSLFNTANIGEVRTEKLLELGAKNLSEEQIEEYAELIDTKDATMRDYFTTRYVDFETLDDSILFYPLASVGDVLCPELKEFKEEMVEWTINIAANYEPRD